MPTRLHGVMPETVLAGGTGLYEFTTTGGIPVWLHDMTLTRLHHDAQGGTLELEFLYDDPRWTPARAAATPLATFLFTGVQVLERAAEVADPATPQAALDHVRGFDHDEATGVFALQTLSTFVVFTASELTVACTSPRTADAARVDEA